MRIPLRLPVLFIALGSLSVLSAQQHASDAAQILEGPQTPGTAPARAVEPTLMDNDAVLRMHKAGLSDELILQTITAQPGRYETGADDLIALRQAGLSNGLLTAMASKARHPLASGPSTAPAPIELSPVNEPGLYYKDGKGHWTAMEFEIVHIQGGGFIKSAVTNGIIKPDRNGAVHGRQAALLLPRPIEFLIDTPDGVDGSEYDLLRFRVNSKDREFRALTGGIIHAKGGSQRDEVPFKPVKIAPHTYTFTVGQDTPAAEYGILPPGTGNVTNGGKIYTFAISD